MPTYSSTTKFYANFRNNVLSMWCFSRAELKTLLCSWNVGEKRQVDFTPSTVLCSMIRKRKDSENEEKPGFVRVSPYA